MEQNTQENSIETPQSFREVALQLKTISSTLVRLEQTQKMQHAENIAKMDSLQASYATKEDVKNMREYLESKADKWVETVLIWGGSAVGLGLIGAILDLILKH